MPANVHNVCHSQAGQHTRTRRHRHRHTWKLAGETAGEHGTVSHRDARDVSVAPAAGTAAREAET